MKRKLPAVLVPSKRYTPEDIPGFIGSPGLKDIESIVSMLPDYGNIFEIGTCFGKTAVAFAIAAECQNKMLKVYTADNAGIVQNDWHNIKEIKDFITQSGSTSLVDAAKIYMAGYNIEFLNVTVDNDYVFNDPLVCFYEDAEHSYDTLKENIEWGYKRLVSGGILCGHDFHSVFPDVVRLVEEFSKSINVEYNVVPPSTVWWLRKP